jgi:hypothetical protein
MSLIQQKNKNAIKGLFSSIEKEGRGGEGRDLLC